jgi:hypothetical protein
MQAVVAIQMRIGMVRSFLALIVALGHPALTIKISKEMSRSILRKVEPHAAFCLSGTYLGLGSMPQALLLVDHLSFDHPAHGGRLWATANTRKARVFQFTMRQDGAS